MRVVEVEAQGRVAEVMNYLENTFFCVSRNFMFRE